ncbi:ParB/RepB/Spo0J family partition protein [Patescibacteria group bacterium]|nr:ParB/RepB/Spo0J family partition protein [Patescibacteria group bacterium]
MAKQIVDIDVNELQSNPLQPRGLVTPESLVELVDSIKEHGVLEPLVVAKTPAGYQIIAGERRWRAAKMAGLSTVPSIIKETSPRGMLEMALVENVQREDLNPLDRAKAFIRLIEEFGLTNKEISKRISKSSAYISNSIKLLSLPDALKDGLLSGLITEGHARALASIDDVKLMIEAYKIILRESGSVRRAEEVARRMKKRAKQPTRALDKQAPLIISEEFDKLRDEIHAALGGDEDIIVKVTRSRAQTKVLITLKGNLKKTEDNLQKIYKGIAKKN